MLFAQVTRGQSAYLNSPSAMGKGGTGVSTFDSWASLSNPAGTSKHSQTGASASYYLPYFINELSAKNALILLPFKWGVLSTHFQQFGNSSYQENSIGIAYSKSLTPKLHAAFQFNIQNNRLSQSGSGHQFFSNMGLIYEASEHIRVGVAIVNPEQSTITIQDNTTALPSLFVLGFNWGPSSNFDISCELEKQDDYKSLFKLGFQYEIIETVWLRTGVFGKPWNYTLGLGLHIFDFQLDIGMTNHNILGLSSCIGITYLLKQKP
ncbi:hypothetical protein JCM21142_41566 [Saccharicrinis fermentans DSM 9555 = JCM 21142]|uniref:Bacteroidetes-specific membrane protein n=2 Tax=Saccharicrinis fermentans TaxID=982 RepID=W7YEN5_9BACT|nr:hypothetical protein JCM21142_41566 [Saccharicrinis fermentans DSM 9555 = JCM 21142]